MVHATPHDVPNSVIAKTVSIVTREPELNTAFAVRLVASYCESTKSLEVPSTRMAEIGFRAFFTVYVTSVEADIRTSTASAPLVPASVLNPDTCGSVVSINLKPESEVCLPR